MMGYYTDKAKAVKEENDAKIATLEEALGILGVNTEEVPTDEE